MTKDLSDFIKRMEQVIEDWQTQRRCDVQHFEKLIRKLEDEVISLKKEVALLKQEDAQ